MDICRGHPGVMKWLHFFNESMHDSRFQKRLRGRERAQAPRVKQAGWS